MRGFRCIAAVAGLAVAALPVFAQSASEQQVAPDQGTVSASAIPVDQQATKEQIEKLLEVMRTREEMKAVMELMPRVVEQAFNAQIKSINAKLPPGKRLMPPDQAALESVMNKYMQRAQNLYPIDEMISDEIPIYERHMSKSDADAVIAFYSSQAGQHLLNERPAITREKMTILMSRIQERSKQLTDEMEAEMRQIVKPDIDPRKPAGCFPPGSCGR